MDAPATETFLAADGLKLFAEVRDPAGGATPRAAIVIAHGYAEHAGRYRDLADALAADGYGVLSFDYRGHGRAEGRRGHCARFGDFLGDLDRACARARTRFGDAPLVLVGMSHGALITLRALVEPERAPAGVRGAVLVAPYLGLAMKVPAVKILAARLASRLVPTLSLPNGVDSSKLAHDPAVGRAYDADPLVHHVATARWFTESTDAQAAVAALAARLAVPTLWLIAGDDRIADPRLAAQIAERAGGPPAPATAVTAAQGGSPRPDRTIRVYDGLWHELLNEPAADRDRVLADLRSWLAARFPAA